MRFENKIHSANWEMKKSWFSSSHIAFCLQNFRIFWWIYFSFVYLYKTQNFYSDINIHNQHINMRPPTIIGPGSLSNNRHIIFGNQHTKNSLYQAVYRIVLLLQDVYYIGHQQYFCVQMRMMNKKVFYQGKFCATFSNKMQVPGIPGLQARPPYKQLHIQKVMFKCQATCWHSLVAKHLQAASSCPTCIHM